MTYTTFAIGKQEGSESFKHRRTKKTAFQEEDLVYKHGLLHSQNNIDDYFESSMLTCI